MRGTYVLVIKVKKKINICIGKLGKFTFPTGYYIYIGSGQNNLEKRVQRHLRKEKKLFWHVDYLLNHPEVEIKRIWIREGKRWECNLARKIAKDTGFKAMISKFGSSDCGCETHLFLVLKPGKEDKVLRQNRFFLLDSI